MKNNEVAEIMDLFNQLDKSGINIAIPDHIPVVQFKKFLEAKQKQFNDGSALSE